MSASHSLSGSAAPYYYVPADSKHPVRASAAMLAVLFGAATWINSIVWGKWVFWAGIAAFILVLFGWFGDAIRESEGGMNSARVDVSYRWSMSWFIFSEVMFFSAFFGALWYVRSVTTPWLGDLDHQQFLWPDFVATWPNLGPGGAVEEFQVVGPFWLPTINTALLLSSGVTLTIAHHALRANHRAQAIFWLFATVVLGFTFVGCQAYEYMHAYADLNLRFDHADRLSRLSRHHGCHHAHRHAVSPDARPLHRQPALRL